MDKNRKLTIQKFLFRMRNKKYRDCVSKRSPGYLLPADDFDRKAGKKKEDYISVMI